MACDKIKNRCGKPNYAKCVDYQGDIPEWSDLEQNGCNDIEEVIEDLYSNVGDIKELLDVSTYDLDCLEEVEDIRELFELLISEVCQLKSTVATQAETIESLQEQVTNLQENNCP